jgi:copper chaperone
MLTSLSQIPPARIQELTMPHPESKTYTAHGMTCEHCRVAVARAIAQIEGVESVDVALATGRVRVVGTNVADEAVAAAVADEGYEVAS